MKNIYLIFTLGNSIFSELIAKTTKRPQDNWEDVPSHVAIVFFNYLVVESKATGGFHISTLDQFLKDKVKITYSYCIPDSDLEFAHSKLENILRTKNEVKYDWLGAIWLGVNNLIYNAFKIRLSKNPWHSSKRDFCVEFVESILNKELSNTSPLDLELELRKSTIDC